MSNGRRRNTTRDAGHDPVGTERANPAVAGARKPPQAGPDEARQTTPAAAAAPAESRKLTAESFSVIEPYSYQRRMATNAARFAMYEWSRQTGKSMGVALLVNANVLEVEATGKRTLWTVISRSLAQARELARKIRDVGRAVMAARNVLKGIGESETRDSLGETQLELTYPGGSRVIVVSGNPDAAAGYTGNVVWDEVGLTRNAHDLFGVAFPVVSRGGYRFIMTSTPRPGFWCQRIDDARQPGSPWYAETMTIHEAVAQGCPQNPDELRAALKDDLRWRQEFLCEHIDDEICWLPWELIVGATDGRCATALSRQHSAVSQTTGPIYGGWDVARWQNLSVLVVLERVGGALLTRAVEVMQRMPFDTQLARVKAVLAEASGGTAVGRHTRLCIDATGMGEMVAEQAGRQIGGVEAVKLTGTVKEVLAGDLRRVLEERTLRLPDDDALRNDLHSVQRTMTAAGNPRFEGEVEGSHADRFWALALAVHGALATGGGITGEQAGMLKRALSGQPSAVSRSGEDELFRRRRERRATAGAGKGIW